MGIYDFNSTLGKFIGVCAFVCVPNLMTTARCQLTLLSPLTHLDRQL